MRLNYFAEVKDVKELKKQYHKLVLKNHPDKGGDHEVMVAIVLEYEWALENLYDIIKTVKRYKTQTSKGERQHDSIRSI